MIDDFITWQSILAGENEDGLHVGAADVGLKAKERERWDYEKRCLDSSWKRAYEMIR